MKMPSCAITDFRRIRPRYENSQKETLDWILAAHIKAEEKQGVISHVEIKERLNRAACKPGIIDKRGHEIADFCHLKWAEMLIYRLEESPEGASLAKRQEVHAEVVDRIFEQFFFDEGVVPDDVIHVTCTGYTSPSAAQKIISRHNWQALTEVTHLYHMGCYASIPALRIASGFALQGRKTNIVHTELCTLHKNPSCHDLDQFVVQSLFADGFIKYTVCQEKAVTGPYFKILALYEEIIPCSLDLMSWQISNWGFKFSLSKEIPAVLVRALKPYLERLCKKAGLDCAQVLEKARFAIHPGGPKIVDYAQKFLSLNEDQLMESRFILQQCGNMSSATLPHIWEEMLYKNARPGEWVVSLAFGPGLTIAGAIFQEVG